MARTIRPAQQWVFPGVLLDDQRGTVRVTRTLRRSAQVDYKANSVQIVTYYNAIWRGDTGGTERFTITPEILEKMRRCYRDEGEGV